MRSATCDVLMNAAFVITPSTLCSRGFFGQSLRESTCSPALKVAVCRRRRFSSLMPTMSASETQAPKEEEEEAEEGPLQGPSQAPTGPGVSTAGLDEKDAKFIIACYDAEISTIESMLDAGQDVTICDVNKRTALHFCAGNGLHTLCQKLLDAGANIDQQDILGFTPLHMATGYKKVETVRFLIEAGADANIASFKGDLPVEIAENMLEGTPEKKFFMPNGQHSRLTEIVELLDEATELEDDDEEETEVGSDGTKEFTEETESAKFVVRVKPKGEVTQATTSAPPPSDVSVTIRIKEPEKK